MINEADRLDRIGGHHGAIVDGDEVVAILLLSLLGEIRRAGEEHGIGIIKIDHDELVMDLVSESFLVLLRERRRNELGEGRGLYQDAGRFVRLVEEDSTTLILASFIVGNTIREDLWVCMNRAK